MDFTRRHDRRCSVCIALVASTFVLGCVQRTAGEAGSHGGGVGDTPQVLESSDPMLTVGIPAAATPTVPGLMKAHFVQAAALRQAVVDGDLEKYKAVAVWLAEKDLAGPVPETWKVGLEGMHDAARLARDAVDLAGAARATGALGAACAGCHLKLGMPPVTLRVPPPEGSSQALHMGRHQWAVEMMWTGLMAPSDQAWIVGAEIMGDAPLAHDAIAADRTVGAAVGALAETTHAIGERARTVERNERGAAYADLLVTCASCHRVLPRK